MNVNIVENSTLIRPIFGNIPVHMMVHVSSFKYVTMHLQ